MNYGHSVFSVAKFYRLTAWSTDNLCNKIILLNLFDLLLRNRPFARGKPPFHRIGKINIIITVGEV